MSGKLVHGGGLDCFMRSIADGMPDKGMLAWSETLTETRIRSLAIFNTEGRANTTFADFGIKALSRDKPDENSQLVGCANLCRASRRGRNRGYPAKGQTVIASRRQQDRHNRIASRGKNAEIHLESRTLFQSPTPVLQLQLTARFADLQSSPCPPEESHQ